MSSSSSSTTSPLQRGTSDAFALKLERNNSLLAELGAPQALYQGLMFCSERPRMSSKLDSFAADLLAVGERLGCEVARDDIGNVLWRAPASSADLADRPVVCLQAHMDMVCSAHPQSPDGTSTAPPGEWFDFETQPIQLEKNQDGTCLKAWGTTLGADNAIGIAACMALLTDETAVHPPLECLFTVDEETTMAGAEKLAQAPFLKAKYLLNLDSEEHGAICVGCAGGFEAQLRLPLHWQAAPSDHSVLRLSIGGLVGGHTGVDIHRGRANAVLLLVRLLHSIGNPGHRLLVDFNGGSVINTIPREAQATILCPLAVIDAVTTALQQEWTIITTEYQSIERAPTFLIQRSDVDHSSLLEVCSEDASRRALDLLALHPNGPLRMNPFNQAEVATSISLSIVQLSQAHQPQLLTHAFCRADSKDQMNHVYRQLQSLARLSGAEITDQFNAFPSWTPNVTSPAYHAVVEAAKLAYGHDPRVYSVHAGLEVGFLFERYPQLHCASFGPAIHDAHTPDERLELRTVEPFYNLLKHALRILATSN